LGLNTVKTSPLKWCVGGETKNETAFEKVKSKMIINSNVTPYPFHQQKSESLNGNAQVSSGPPVAHNNHHE